MNHRNELNRNVWRGWIFVLLAMFLATTSVYGAGGEEEADSRGGGVQTHETGQGQDGRSEEAGTERERTGPGAPQGDTAPAQETSQGDAGPAPRADERRRMVERHIAGAGVEDSAVLEAMRSVPRHEFVPTPHEDQAYANRPLPIGHGQTISQPYIVAYMTEVLDPDSEDIVLEVGTGSGYQAAVLAGIVDEVYTIEIIEPLAQTGRERLERLGYDNAHVRQGDGYFGWPEHAPFDAIIVTAAAGHIPQPLVEQLRPGGRMVIPVGPVFAVQTLILVNKSSDGEITTEQLLPVRFVPMTGRVQEGQ